MLCALQLIPDPRGVLNTAVLAVWLSKSAEGSHVRSSMARDVEMDVNELVAVESGTYQIESKLAIGGSEW